MRELVVNNYPKSSVTESIKMIRANLRFSSINKNVKTILVTSSIAGEGKSFISANLSAVFTTEKEKVLLIDCDLRKPKIHKNFGLMRNHGVSDVVLSKGTLDYKQAIQIYKKNDLRLDVLTAGSKISNPSELINSEGFARLLKETKDDLPIEKEENDE